MAVGTHSATTKARMQRQPPSLHIPNRGILPVCLSFVDPLSVPYPSTSDGHFRTPPSRFPTSLPGDKNATLSPNP
jgi:hypothetical protein